MKSWRERDWFHMDSFAFSQQFRISWINWIFFVFLGVRHPDLLAMKKFQGNFSKLLFQDFVQRQEVEDHWETNIKTVASTLLRIGTSQLLEPEEINL